MSQPYQTSRSQNNCIHSARSLFKNFNVKVKVGGNVEIKLAKLLNFYTNIPGPFNSDSLYGVKNFPLVLECPLEISVNGPRDDHSFMGPFKFEICLLKLFVRFLDLKGRDRSYLRNRGNNDISVFFFF